MNTTINSAVSTLESAIATKANTSHTHEISDIYISTTTTTKSLEQLLDERQSALQSLINGKANTSHTHDATEVIYQAASGNNNAITVKQRLDTLKQEVDAAGDSHNWLDWLNTALNAGEAGALGVSIAEIESQISTLQGQIAALQAQIARIQGTDAVSNSIDNIQSEADNMSDFSDVGTDRSLFDSMSDWYDDMGNRISNQTNSYTQLNNNYTSPSFSNVSNASTLAEIDPLLFQL